MYSSVPNKFLWEKRHNQRKFTEKLYEREKRDANNKFDDKIVLLSEGK